MREQASHPILSSRARRLHHQVPSERSSLGWGEGQSLASCFWLC
jgi:hypothetical protein